MKKIILRRKLPLTWDGNLFAGIPPLLQRIYVSRGITTSDELSSNFADLLNYDGLQHLDLAVEILYQALVQQSTILIVGDFDADGATSTAVAIRSLKMFGAKAVDFLVPNRFAFGYGLTPELVAVALSAPEKPELIITVDNGIANHAGVLAAKSAGIKVVITDHHLPGDSLPDADAIVNPNQRLDTFPSKNLAGVGVIFYVMLALRRKLLAQNWFASQGLPMPNMAKLLDLVALGTIADLVALDRNNRVLVHNGVRLINQRQCVPGITALLKVAGKNQETVTATDLAYAVASRLNAAGRMDDMSIGINCLLTDDYLEASVIAHKLNSLNDERRSVEHDMKSGALSILSNLPDYKNELPYGICLFQESWHQGVIGILAARIKDRYHLPTIIFAVGHDHELKGSARSIPQVHIRDVLANISTKHPKLIKKFGGHAMAAGLTINREDLSAFVVAFNEELSHSLHSTVLQNLLHSDGELAEEELNLNTAEMIANAGPWGQAFPEPIFDDVFKVLEQRLVGRDHLKLTLAKGKRQIQGIAFYVDHEIWPNYRCQDIHAAYRLDVNHYLKKRNLQLIIEHLEPYKQ